MTEILSQSSEHDLSADPDSDEDDTKMEASDNGCDELQDPRDPMGRHGKEKDVTLNILRHILSAPAVPGVRINFSCHQVSPSITKCTTVRILGMLQ